MELKNLRYPSAIYRVSVKAIIRRTDGKILSTRDKTETDFELPGGGVEFGETIEMAIARELREEVGYDGDFSLEFFAVNTNLKDEMWRMAMIFFVKIPDLSDDKFSCGDEIAEMKWLDAKFVAKSEFYRGDIARKLSEI